MTGYAKDVAAKISSSTRVMPNPNGVDSRRSEGKHGTPTRQTSSAEKQRHKSSDFKANEPKLWSVKDVLDWLEYISLPVYKQVFQENAVDGAILLDLSLDDLDYMQITALGTFVVTTLHIDIHCRSSEDYSQGNRGAEEEQANNSAGLECEFAELKGDSSPHRRQSGKGGAQQREELKGGR